jgi:uncharacterized membrane protein YoaK (UPF0700 family)
LLLAVAALCYAFGRSEAAVAAIVLAMGLENAVGGRWGWVPNLLLWVALVVGAACGASAYHWINLAAIWFAAGMALSLSAMVAVTTRS